MSSLTTNPQVTSPEDCATLLLRTIQQLREDHGVAQEEEVSLYVTDIPLVHSTLSEYESEIMAKGNLVDVVQVNVKAGNPMPDHLPQTECQIGEESVTIAIEQQANA